MRRLAAAALFTAAFATVSSRVLVTQEKALAEAFPGALVERHTAYLTEEQVVRIEALAGSKLAGHVIPWYSMSRDGRFAGTAWFDTHLVRTMPETVMVAIGPQGAIARIEVLSFGEPPEYLPKPRWFEQFRGRTLDPDLSTGRGVPLVTGATLSSRAATAAARRALALHTVLVGTEPAVPPVPAVPPPLQPAPSRAAPSLPAVPPPPQPAPFQADPSQPAPPSSATPKPPVPPGDAGAPSVPPSPTELRP